jgi:phospholipid-translocating ATPase
MGVIVRDDQLGEIVFYMKGADTVMNRIVLYNDVTLVVAKRPMSDEQYSEFDTRYQAAKMALADRAACVVESL